ncbi:MAG TPA: glycosyltransferase family 1 protein [Nitrospirae bacterium]|nr:glycosyltransferase family 1 protein [Nitrospirota bacterium]
MFTILHTESSRGWGGQEIRILKESLGMLSKGHRVIIAASERSELYPRAKTAGIKVYPVSFVKKNPLSIARTTSIINRESIDILNTHSSSDSWIATFGAKIAGNKPLILRTRHLSTPIGKSFLSRLIYEILPDKVITTGEEIRQRMTKLNGFDGNKICSIPTGIDLNIFNPEKTIPCLEKTGFYIGMVSVLRSWKGHEYFIKAVPEILKSIPEAQFFIVGNGPQHENIRNLIKEMALGKKILMLGHREDVPEIMASLDILVHSSYANEGVPQSILQALAMKKAIVASDAGAIREVILDGETGFLIKSRDHHLITDRVTHLYKNPELRIKLGERGREMVHRNYSFEGMLDRIEALYRQLFENKGME